MFTCNIFDIITTFWLSFNTYNAFKHRCWFLNFSVHLYLLRKLYFWGHKVALKQICGTLMNIIWPFLNSLSYWFHITNSIQIQKIAKWNASSLSFPMGSQFQVWKQNYVWPITTNVIKIYITEFFFQCTIATK